MEPERILKRKIYDRLLKWKRESNGKAREKGRDISFYST